MMRKIIVMIVGVLVSMGTGALIALWQCSHRRWCPRYLRRQLDAWHRQVSRQNDARHANRRNEASRERRDIPPDEAA